MTVAKLRKALEEKSFELHGLSAHSVGTNPDVIRAIVELADSIEMLKKRFDEHIRVDARENQETS